MSDDVTINVRVNNQTAAGIRDVNGQLRTLDGRFAASAGSMQRSGSAMSRALADAKGALLSLAPAAVPVAASLATLAPIAAQAGAAGVAVAAFGAAVLPQIANLKDAAAAQTKYSDAVRQYGAQSKEAAAAQQQAATVLAGIPKATQQAAAAYSNLKGTFTAFSDSTAKFTMTPVTHAFAVLGQVIPKLTPMVASTSTQLDRLMKVAGGAVNSSGFDALSKRVSDFANESLKNATDGAIHFIRVMSEGDAHGPLTEFMDYARKQGPAVKELLTNLMDALGNIAQGAADAGPGLMTVVNAMAHLVAALPPELIGNLMQVYTAFKLITLAGAGIGGVAGGITTLRTGLAGLTAASAAAGGGLAGLRAAFMSLSVGARAALITTGVGAIVVALGMLSSMGDKTPPDVDKVTTSLKGLAETGKNVGESARAWGTNFDGLSKSLSRLNPKGFDGFLQGWAKFLGTDSTKVKTSKEDIDSLDKSLAGLVKGNKADVAAKALEGMGKKLKPKDFKELKSNLDDYKAALADQALEAKLTAESQGLFGQAAQDTAAKLDAQKSSADGLRGAIQALNDVNRAGLGGMIGFESAIDAAAKAAKDNAGALSMTNGVLNLGSEKARNAASALQDLADKTDGAAASARESGSSWETVNGIYTRGRAALIKNAEAMGLTKTQAAALADQILKIPNKTATVKMNVEDAKRDITSFNAAIKATPGSKSVTLTTLSSSGEKILESFGYKVKHLPNGKVSVTAATGGALSGIGNVASALRRLNGQTARTYTFHRVTTTYVSDIVKGSGSLHDSLASGGRVRGYAGGGDVQVDPSGLVRGPGSGTSDSILAMFGSGAVGRISNTEFVVNAASTKKYLPLLKAINSNSLPGFAKGGVTKAEQQARAGARGDLTVSHYGQIAGYKRSEFGSAMSSPDSVSSLVNSLNQWATTIKAATHGGAEKALMKALDSTGKKLLGWEKQLNAVTKSLDSAKSKLNDLKSAASSLASSVKSGVLGAANITRGASGDAPVTTRSVMAGLTASRDKAAAFSKALADLQKKGLSSALLQQIGEAGIDGGGMQTASALLNASPSEIKSMNALQSQITTSAGAAGATTADAVYGAQIKAQQASVDALTKSQAKLTAAMDKAAAAMEKAIEKAFAKKAAGGIVGAAASGGLRSGLTMVGEHGFELVDLPPGARVWSNPDSRRKVAAAQAPWASMLNTPRHGGVPHMPTPFAGRGGSDRPIVLNIRLGEREFGQIWVDVGRKEVSTRGGLRATLGGL